MNYKLTTPCLFVLTGVEGRVRGAGDGHILDDGGNPSSRHGSNAHVSLPHVGITWRQRCGSQLPEGEHIPTASGQRE